MKLIMLSFMAEIITIFAFFYVLLSNVYLYLKKRNITNTEEERKHNLQLASWRGELPIMLEMKLSNEGDYTITIFNRKGLHLQSDNVKKFIASLYRLAGENLNRELIKEKIKKSSKEFQILHFKGKDTI